MAYSSGKVELSLKPQLHPRPCGVRSPRSCLKPHTLPLHHKQEVSQSFQRSHCKAEEAMGLPVCTEGIFLSLPGHEKYRSHSLGLQSYRPRRGVEPRPGSSGSPPSTFLSPPHPPTSPPHPPTPVREGALDMPPHLPPALNRPHTPPASADCSLQLLALNHLPELPECPNYRAKLFPR